LKSKLNYSKFIIELVKSLWLIFNILIAIPYGIAVIEKFRRPTFKNLSSENLITIGIILLVSIILNLLWISKKIKSLSNN